MLSTKRFTLTADQKLKHVDKFMSSNLLEPVPESLAKLLGADMSWPLNALSLPSHFTINMWNKAQKFSSSKKVSGPNLTALAEAKSAGKKRERVTKKLPMKIRSIISDVDELVWQYPQSIDESQGDSLNTGVSTY